MLDEIRIGAIEKVIAQVEAEGLTWTNSSVYEKVGGNYGELAQYLKARRARTAHEGDEAPVTVAVTDEAAQQEAPASLREHLAVARLAQAHASGRLAQLRSQGDSLLLSESEEDEVLRLESRLQRMQPVLERLSRAVEQEQESTDVEAFRQGWQPLADAKGQAYERFAEAVRRLWWAAQGLHDIHLRQERAIDSLPPRLAKRLHEDFLPDAATIRKRLGGLMQPSRGWDIVLNAPPVLPTAEELMSNDPGVRPVPPRLLPNLMERKL